MMRIQLHVLDIRLHGECCTSGGGKKKGSVVAAEGPSLEPQSHFLWGSFLRISQTSEAKPHKTFFIGTSQILSKLQNL